MIKRGTLEVDHVVVAVRDLEAAKSYVEREWGCEVLPGGHHKQWGSHNLIVPMVGGCYLELIAAHQDPPEGHHCSRVFRLDSLPQQSPGELFFVDWAVRPTATIQQTIPALQLHAGLDLGAAIPGQRVSSNGEILAWTLSDPYADRLGATVPFLLDWGNSAHPSSLLTSPTLQLEGVEIFHPNPQRVSTALCTLAGTQPQNVSSSAEGFANSLGFSNGGTVVIHESHSPALSLRLRTREGVVQVNGFSL